MLVIIFKGSGFCDCINLSVLVSGLELRLIGLGFRVCRLGVRLFAFRFKTHSKLGGFQLMLLGLSWKQNPSPEPQTLLRPQPQPQTAVR